MKIKHYILLFIIAVFVFSCSKGKTKGLNNGGNAILKTVDHYLVLSNAEPVPERKRGFLVKAFDEIKKSKNDSITRQALSKIVYGYYFLKDIEGLDESSVLLLKLSQESKDSINLGLAYRCRGFSYNSKKVLDSTFYYYHKAENLYSKSKDKVNYATVLLRKGLVQYSVGDNLGADLTFTKAYNTFKELNDLEKVFETQVLLGNVSEELKDFDKSIYYYSRALEMADKFEENVNIHFKRAMCYNNIGFVYMKKNDFKRAISDLQKGLKEPKVSDNADNYANLLDNLAYSKLQMNDMTGLPEMFYSALKLRKNLRVSSSVVLSHLHLSQYYTKVNDLNQAKWHVLKALQISREAKIPLDVLASLNQAAEVDKKNAEKYSKEYIILSDSLHIAERKSKDRFASLELQTEEIKEERKVLEERNRNLLLGFGITAIIGGLLFVVRLQRARTRELLYKQAQQKANEEIYNLMISQQAIIDESRDKEKKRLAQDLHDGILGRMFGLRLNLDSLNSFTDEETVQRRMELLSELKTIEQDIREISHDLNREKQVLINNFASIVHNLLEEQQSFHEAKLNFSIDNRIDWDKVGNMVKINLYRILQECLQNINKYANAKNIGVKINGEAENVTLIISDDGVGFDVSKKSKGIGMQNMISRTHECKGVIDVRSGRGNGTTILITIPINTNQLIEEPT